MVKKVSKWNLADINLVVISTVCIYETITEPKLLPLLRTHGICYSLLHFCISSVSPAVQPLYFLALASTFRPASSHASLLRSLSEFLLLMLKEP